MKGLLITIVAVSTTLAGFLDADTAVKCPALTCSKEYFVSKQKPDKCFIIETEAPYFNIWAQDCYDKDAQKVKDSTPKFCTYDHTNNEFAWLEEGLYL